jgi:hypothetical protein
MPYAITDHEYTLDGGTTLQPCTSGMDNGNGTATVPVGDVDKATGQVGVRVKAATGRNVSAWLWNAVPFVKKRISASGDAIITQYGSNQAMQVPDSASDFNVGSGDFALIWKGFLFSTPPASARLVSKATSTAGPLLYITATGQLVAAFRTGTSTLYSLTWDTLPTIGQDLMVVFQRKGGNNGNLAAADYELIINGAVAQTTKNFTTLASANIDNNNPFYTGYAGTANVPHAAHELAGFYKRALTTSEIEETLSLSFPSDGAIWLMKNAGYAGTSIPVAGTLGQSGLLQNFGTKTDTGSQTAFSRAATALKVLAGETGRVKVINTQVSLSRVFVITPGTTIGSVTVRILSAADAEIQSFVVTLTAVDGQTYAGTFPSATINAGQKLEVTFSNTATLKLASFF